MDKDSDHWISTSKQGDALLNGGMYRKAISKFKSALTALQKIGHDEKNVFAIQQRIISCHEGLEEVSIAELS